MNELDKNNLYISGSIVWESILSKIPVSPSTIDPTLHPQYTNYSQLKYTITAALTLDIDHCPHPRWKQAAPLPIAILKTKQASKELQSMVLLLIYK